MDNAEANKNYRVKRLGAQYEGKNGGGEDALSHEVWGLAEVLGDFSFPWTKMEAPETLFRALWDDDLFYFRFEVVDEDVVLAEGADAKEQVVGSDRVEIFFTTGDDLDPYYGLEMDPRGEVLSYETRYHRQFNWEWECPGLKIWPKLTDVGYELEGSIPMQTFRDLECLHEKNGQPYLKAGLFRAEFSHGAGDDPVKDDWISRVNPGGEIPDFHVPSAFGVLSFER